MFRLVCPPYDIISPSRQDYYHALDAHNFIHILLGKDILGDDKYKRASRIFREWLDEEILIQEKSPAIYFYSQEYKIKGEKRTRLGFIALLHLQDYNTSIFGHEHTRLESKTDRLRLLKATRANLSPIFVIFADKKRIIRTTYQKYIQNKDPFIDIKDDEKIVHKLWKINAPEILAEIEAKMKNENIFIADGHHRYEVALAYRQDLKKKLGAISGDEDFNYLLAYFSNSDSKGLSIFPIHRLVKLGQKIDWEIFLSQLKDYFDVQEIKDRVRFFFLMEKAGLSERLLGMYKDRRFWLLRLKNIKILDKLISEKSKEYRTLDVSIFNYIVLSKILGLELEDKEKITFSPNANELMEKVDSDPSYIAFFLNPVKIEQIMQVALSGQKLPAKSTYFYPKVLSGLVINKHEYV